MRTSGGLARWARVLMVGASVFAMPLEAQNYFGQNQVQYDRLRWRVTETEHFLVHYYPEIADMAPDAARMAERSYARLSRLMGHQFREKKPILLFGSSGDFAQSNVFGDLGEGTGGVTDPLRQRMAQFYTGDYGSFEHVLQHEMVHVFQFDIFSRGRAGAGLQNFAMVNPPLWFMEGLAEYFSIGQHHPWTDAWVRDAVVNGTLPSIAQMTERPDKYFPYRYGLAVWQYIGTRWGDEVIAEVMNSIPSLGIDRAFRRELGVSVDDLSEEWKQAMQAKYLPLVASLDRPRKFAEPLLTQRRSGGIVNMFVAPSLSDDGKSIAFIAYGSLIKGEVFPDLYLADAETGKREARLVKSTTNPDFEQLRFIYSQPSFSPDGKQLAFTGQRGGHDVLYLLDVASRKVIKRFDLDLDQVLSPSFSPDGKQIVFSGLRHGESDLFMVSVSGGAYRQLTKDKYGDAQPQWSPDGRTIAFASDRGPETDFDILRIGKWKISLYDVQTGDVTVLPGQGGLNINPQWAPDGRSLAFVSDRTGTANLYLYDLDAKQHYQLTNVVGAITAVAEYSPAITWARGADVLAFVYYEKGDHTVWKVKNPRSLKKEPFRDSATATTVAALPDAAPGGTNVASAVAPSNTSNAPLPLFGGSDKGAHLPTAVLQDTTAARRSFYRSPMQGTRLSGDLPAMTLAHASEQVSVTALMDSFDFHLPDTTRFKDYRYKVRFSPEYVAQPSIGYQQGGYGTGTYGGTTIILSDLLGDHRLAISGSLNGTLSDAQLFVGYTNLARRLQYSSGIMQQPAYLYVGNFQSPIDQNGQGTESQEIVRLVIREAYLTGLYPLNRFSRFEFGASVQNVDQQVFAFTRSIDYARQLATQWQREPAQNVASATNLLPYAAYVTDNTMFGYTGPIAGKRMRLQVQPSIGDWKLTEFLADARSYYPILFNYVTFAARFVGSLSVGRDESRFPKWIGRPDFVRGYSNALDGYAGGDCTGLPSDTGSSCRSIEAIGSRVAFTNLELRYPILRKVSPTSIGLPPIDGLFFYDAGFAWSAGQKLLLTRPADYDYTTQRALLSSYGFGFRMNVYNLAIVRWDYAVPLNRPGVKGFGTWFFGMSY